MREWGELLAFSGDDHYQIVESDYYLKICDVTACTYLGYVIPCNPATLEILIVLVLGVRLLARARSN